MAIARTDWEQYRDLNSDIPPDIFFRVSEDSRRDENIEVETEEEGDKTKMIGAHKLLLAGTSPVFKANFFGGMKMTGEVMVVKETTMEAFSTLINFIYWPPGKGVFSLGLISCFEQLCNIVEISERYQVLDLKKVAKDALQNLEVTAKNVIVVATIADRYKAFEDVNKILMTKSLAFLERTMITANDVISFIVETKHDFPENGLEMLHDILKRKLEKKEQINGWDISLFSEPKEQKIARYVLTTITEPCKQWRITHDFKPTEYQTGYNKTLCLTDEYRRVLLEVFFTNNTTFVLCRDPWPGSRRSIPVVPPIGEWTTIDITNEELEPGKCMLTVVIGGNQVFQEESTGSRGLANFFQVMTAPYDNPSSNRMVSIHPGLIRKLSITTKK